MRNHENRPMPQQFHPIPSLKAWHAPGAHDETNAEMLSPEWKRNKNPRSCDLRSRADDIADQTMTDEVGFDHPPDHPDPDQTEQRLGNCAKKKWINFEKMWPVIGAIDTFFFHRNSGTAPPCRHGLCRPTIRSAWVPACRHRCKELLWGPPGLRHQGTPWFPWIINIGTCLNLSESNMVTIVTISEYANSIWILSDLSDMVV